MIIIGGMIGIGKTTTASILQKETGLPTYFESVEGNEVLPLFYKANKEEKERYRYPFLLQMSFLRSRFHTIKEASKHQNAIMDRSIFEDYYFAKKNHELGNINDMEMKIYESFLNEILDSTKNDNAVMIYLHGKFDTVLERIKTRGRDFELSQSLVSYYRFLYDGYDKIIKDNYKDEHLIDIDVDKIDLLNNKKDLLSLLEELKQRSFLK